jgi:hypothetical protein
VLTSQDRAVPPRWQRDLAAGLGAQVFESPGDHFAAAQEAEGFNRALLRALDHVVERASVPAAA